MTVEQLQRYDRFLDENDWDIYYWVTQEQTPTSAEYAEGGGPDMATKSVQGKSKGPEYVNRQTRKLGEGEWAQTVGTFKPAHRHVPARWQNSDIIQMLKQHVIDRSAGGVLGSQSKPGGGLGMSGELEVTKQNMDRMPELRNNKSSS